MPLYEVAKYEYQLDQLNLQPDERESFELIRTLSEDFTVDESTAMQLDGALAKVLASRARLANRPAPPAPAPAPSSLPAPAAAPSLPEPEPAPARAPRKKKTTDPDDEVAQKFEALFKRLLEMIASKGGMGVSKEELEEWINSRKIGLDDLEKSIKEKLGALANVQVVQYNFPFQAPVQAQKSEQPAAQKIVDELMLGNNVMLIGGAGTGKTYLGQQVTRQILNREMETINCSQWTSPIEVVGGQSLEGYVEGKMVQAWRDGKVLLLDELPKIDPNTAGLFNEALAKTGDRLVLRPDRDQLRTNVAGVLGAEAAETALAELSKHNSPELFYLHVEKEAIGKNIKPNVRYELMVKLFSYPLLQNNRKQYFVKHPYFGCIATGNVYPNGTDAAYGANNKQDLSLLDRFVGSVYFIQKNPALERHVLQNDFVWSLCNKLRDEIERGKYEAQVSLRLMQTARRAFDQELGRYTGTLKDGLAANEGKTFKDVIDSFITSGFTEVQTQNLKTVINYQSIVANYNYRSYGAGAKLYTFTG